MLGNDKLCWSLLLLCIHDCLHCQPGHMKDAVFFSTTIFSSFHLPTDHWFIFFLANWPLIHRFTCQLTTDSYFFLPTDRWFIFFLANWPLIHCFTCQRTTDSSFLLPTDHWFICWCIKLMYSYVVLKCCISVKTRSRASTVWYWCRNEQTLTHWLGISI